MNRARISIISNMWFGSSVHCTNKLQLAVGDKRSQVIAIQQCLTRHGTNPAAKYGFTFMMWPIRCTKDSKTETMLNQVLYQDNEIVCVTEVGCLGAGLDC